MKYERTCEEFKMHVFNLDTLTTCRRRPGISYGLVGTPQWTPGRKGEAAPIPREPVACVTVSWAGRRELPTPQLFPLRSLVG